MGQNNLIKLSLIGQGMGDYRWTEKQIDIIKYGINNGINFIDTCEVYDNGNSEIMIGKAIRRIRDKVIIGTKFGVKNTSYKNIIKAVEGSLRRLNTDYIDIYQNHWLEISVPIEETLKAMEKLLKDGKIRGIGLGNLSIDELKFCVKNLSSKILIFQMEYNLIDNFVEKKILPFCVKNNIKLIAYTPIYYGKVLLNQKKKKIIEKIAKKYNKSIMQINLRWLMNKKNVIPIITTSNLDHMKENIEVLDFSLDKEDIDKINNDIVFNDCEYVEPNNIIVSSQGEYNRKVYKDIEEAKKNKLNLIPSPLELSKKITKDIKPVHLLKCGENKYKLMGGRIKYWAWVIKFGNLLIPSYVLNN